MDDVGFEITVLQKDGGPLTKTMRLFDGAVRNDSSQCRMSTGWATRTKCESVVHLAAVINRCGPNEAIAIGRLKAGIPEKVKIVRKCALRECPEAVARSLDHFEFADGSGLCLLDIDLKGAPAGLDPLDALCSALPRWDLAPYVSRPSTSHGITDKAGKEYPGSKGQHIYLWIRDQRDTPRFLRALHDRLWLAGKGWGLASAAGSFLERSPIDIAVGSPERLCFEGAPILIPPLVQSGRQAIVRNPGMPPLDTLKACPPLTESEAEEVARLKAKEEARLLPERARKRFEWGLPRIKALVNSGVKEPDARIIVERMIDNGELHETFVLQFDTLGDVTVGAVLANPQECVGKTLSDPHEGPAYGRGKAILYRREDGSLIVNSYAHGGRKYALVVSKDKPDVFKLKPEPYKYRAPATVPPRQFVYGRHYIREIISVTVAPGGLGKSSLVLVECIAMVTGRPLLGVAPRKPRRVWYINLEDSRTVIESRIAAICLHYSINPEEIGDRLFFNGRETEIILATQAKTGTTISEPVFDALEAALTEDRIDALAIDPFISSHHVTENDNPAVDAIAKKLGRLAEKTNTAIELVHHVRKTNGAEITIEDARGASALVDASRSARALNRMTDAEGKDAGIKDSRRLYFRIDDAGGKDTFSAPSDKAEWYRFANVDLGNATEDDDQDQIGVVAAWKWPDAFAGVTMADLDKVRAKVREGEWRADAQASQWVGYAVADVLDLDPEEPADKAKIKGVLKQWFANKALVKVPRKGTDRHEHIHVECGPYADKSEGQ